MRVIEHVEHLLRQGRKPKELVELGFPKQVVTRVRRQMKKETAASQPNTGPQLALTSPSLESKVQELEKRVEILEALGAGLEDIKNRLEGTPALGLRQHFECNCGASDFVALHIQCTKCGEETWWGWFPK